MSKEILTERMMKNDNVLEHLSETYIAFVYIRKPTNTFICSTKFELFFEQPQRRSILNFIRN